MERINNIVSTWDLNILNLPLESSHPRGPACTLSPWKFITCRCAMSMSVRWGKKSGREKTTWCHIMYDKPLNNERILHINMNIMFKKNWRSYIYIHNSFFTYSSFQLGQEFIPPRISYNRIIPTKITSNIPVTIQNPFQNYNHYIPTSLQQNQEMACNFPCSGCRYAKRPSTSKPFKGFGTSTRRTWLRYIIAMEVVGIRAVYCCTCWSVLRGPA